MAVTRTLLWCGAKLASFGKIDVYRGDHAFSDAYCVQSIDVGPGSARFKGTTVKGRQKATGTRRMGQLAPPVKPAPKPKLRPASKGRVRKGKSRA